MRITTSQHEMNNDYFSLNSIYFQISIYMATHIDTNTWKMD